MPVPDAVHRNHNGATQHITDTLENMETTQGRDRCASHPHHMRGKGTTLSDHVKEQK